MAIIIGALLIVFRNRLAAHTVRWDERSKRTWGTLTAHQYGLGWALAGLCFIAFGMMQVIWPQ